MKTNSLVYLLYIRLKMLYLLSALFISMHDLSNFNVYQSEITLVIKGEEDLFFLNSAFNPEPDEVIINGQIKNSCKKSYNFTEELNDVVIKFNSTIESCENMFAILENIIEIDLSNFDFSNVVNMTSMFYKCTNLEKINFGKINTQSVQRMDYLFNNCYKLTSIDLSNFNTSSVITMSCMFKYCTSLTSIDASMFDTKNVVDMYDIFASCYKLITVNVSSFDTLKVTILQKN